MSNTFIVTVRMDDTAMLVERARERIPVMGRLRNGVIILVLGTSLSGCSTAHYSLFHCDSVMTSRPRHMGPTLR